MNKHHLFTRLVVALLLFAQLSTGWTQINQSQTLCVPSGYTIGFFNGVFNTRAEAFASMRELTALVGTERNGEHIKYDLFYNQTGKNAANATWWQDIAEVFIQRAQEFDSSGELVKRFEYLWEIASDSNKTFLNQLIDASSAAVLMLDSIYTTFMTKIVAGLATLVSDPPTLQDYMEHRAKLDGLAIEGQKLLLVAHSQGNLFVNKAYEYAIQKTDPISVGALHIAPASVVLNGEHVLADIDLIINPLRREGIASVPAVNLFLPFSKADPTGHTFIGTYLDPTRNGRQTVQRKSLSALDRFQSPTSFEPASTGFFTITMTWDGLGDVDLHTIEPGGTQVFYRHFKGQSGYLDVDNTYADGPEHYYASCHPAQLKTGIYTRGLGSKRIKEGHR